MTGPERARFADLLVDAFTQQRFEEMLSRRLDKRLERLVSRNDDFDAVMFKVLELADMDNWLLDLLAAARAARPRDPGLQAFGSRYGLGPAIVTPDGPLGGERRLESHVRKARSAYNIAEWRSRLGEIEGQVCRVEFAHGRDLVRATGFLVGPDVVLTNHHVVRPILDGKVEPSAVTLLFDHAYAEDGTTRKTGTPYRLATDWCLGASPSSISDRRLCPVREPGADELDFALLRVDGSPGDDPVGGPTGDTRPPPRGWVTMPDEDHDFESSPAVHIVQHPHGRPMVVMVDTEAVIGVNAARTRVRYRTNTEPGSSGSPCFGADWQWIAVHQTGDPAYASEGTARYNQGVPVTALRKATEQWNTGGALGV